MSSAGFSGQLTKSALLDIETICDRYEDDLRAGISKSLSLYLLDIDVRLRARLRQELLAIQSASVRNRETLVPRGEADTNDCSRISAHDLSRDPSPLSERFEFAERLGMGGSSSVWKARDKELDRWVALKIPHRETVADPQRFLRESRLTAQLQHPNIVRLHEVGQHDGQSYLVCEFIDGRSLAETLRRRTLAAAETVDLLIQISDGLDYSHDKGIIHRDIKPQNILIDRCGRPHIADFGLACGSSTHELSLTRTGEVLGTPAFMAPEQARGASNDADRRTDVYAMGVVLFNMLTGDLPFRGSIESVIHQIIYADAPSPRQWNRDIPSELEIICLRCLEKEPSRRFETVAQLREELSRFRAGQPIHSRPLSSWGKTAKWVQRNRKVAALATAVFALLLSIAIGSTVSAVMLNHAAIRERDLRHLSQAAIADASRSREQALSAKSRAETEAAISDQTVDFLQTVFQTSDPVAWTLGGQAIANKNTESKPPSPAEMFTVASDRIERELTTKPRVQARLMDILGNSCRGIGMFDRAEQLLDQAAGIRSQVSQPTMQTKRDEATNCFYRGWLRHDLGKYQAAEDLYRQALTLCAELSDSELLAADIRFQLGCLYHATRRNAQARSMFLAARDIREQHLPPGSRGITAATAGAVLCASSPGETPDFHQVATILSGNDWATKLAFQYTRIQQLRLGGNYREASELYQRLLVDLRQSLSSGHPIYVLAQGECAGLLWEAGDYRHAYPMIREAINTGRRLAPQHRHLRNAYLKLGFEAIRAERIDEAEQCYHEALMISTSAGRFDFDAHQGLLWTAYRSGNCEQALQHSRELIARADRFATEQAAWVHHLHARVLAALNRPEQSPEFDAHAIRIARSIQTPPANAVWLDRLSTIYRHHGDLDSAQRLNRLAVELEQKRRPPDHPRIADAILALASTLERQNKTDEAIPLLERACQIQEKQLPLDDARIATTKEWLQRLTADD